VKTLLRLPISESFYMVEVIAVTNKGTREVDQIIIYLLNTRQSKNK